jgi:hypothetical protein
MMQAQLKTRLPVPTERDVLAAVLDTLRAFGIDADRRNVGQVSNAQGQRVRFGRPGDSDVSGTIPAGWGPASGRRIDIECKRPSFDPRKLSGEARGHFARQLDRLRELNRSGGFGLWIRDAGDLVRALNRIRQGWRVDIDEAGFCWLTDEEPSG